ncbi:HNH endonuclease family protein [Micromonospora sp. NPDC047527]|uniref:HNH endonuclease family protein n=1 Tax=unclassified Micromonospora TaxID=2617518 RepID=UPI0033F075FE
MRTRSGSRAAVTALVAALALGVAGCVPPDEPEASPSGGGGNAAQQLGELTVAEAGSMKGYSRSRFPHWRNTGKNCDVRDTILQRDGEDVKLSGCNVVGGRWESVYDGRSAADPSEVDIDHMVPLANAWRSGADEWDDTKRGDFANDTTRPQLFAVSASSNRSKGDQDPSQWKPANRSYWCQYAEDWVAVKHYWRLTVTSAEKSTLADMLEGCTVGSNS